MALAINTSTTTLIIFNGPYNFRACMTVSSWLQLPLELAAVMQQAKNEHCGART
ncbi:hypothetical protein [Stutzerimonas balearica]|uniref:hypothetical protein n=1 Tax=Stutzerimonas balearica TaxID=74829 RepID=UPI0022B035C2|nr:hypothetical protein [Stutzerimonas balearica]MCZ4127801.1 hypothetical protein [Stutzerimonas balearica]